MSTLIFSTEYFLHLWDERKLMLAYQSKHSLGEAVLHSMRHKQCNVHHHREIPLFILVQLLFIQLGLCKVYPVIPQSYQVSS